MSFFQTLDSNNRGNIDSVELVLYGSKEIPQHALSGPRSYPQEYKKKSINEFLASEDHDNSDAKLRLRALIENVQNWI